MIIIKDMDVIGHDKNDENRVLLDVMELPKMAILANIYSVLAMGYGPITFLSTSYELT